MRDLLLAIQSALRSGLDSTVYRVGATPDQSDIFIADAEQYLPSGCRFPAVGIKDGGEATVQRQSCGDGYIEESYTQNINLIAWAPSMSAVIGAGVIGDATQPGVLGIKEHVHAVVIDNMLDAELGVQMVVRGDVPQSYPVQQADGRVGQNLVIPYLYHRKRKILDYDFI